MSIRNGSCLCSSVHVSTTTTRKAVTACHCKMCQRYGGGPAFGFYVGTDVAIEGVEHITVFDSSEWAERGFCATCGSHIFYRLKEAQTYSLDVGILDDTEGLVFEEQLFIDLKPSFYSFADDTRCLTEAEVFAKYASAD